MKSTVRSFLVAALSAAALFPAAAQGRDSILVDARWLNDRLDDPKLVILHLGDSAKYAKAHVPGARYVGSRALVVDNPAAGQVYELPDPDALRRSLAAVGVSDDSRIVVVFADGMIAPATRVVLTLDHAGFGNSVSLLDGGLASWTRAGFATTDQVPAPRTGNLSPLRTRPITVTAEFVRDNTGKPGIALVDARASGFYQGVDESGPREARRRGHIKGALSVPYNSLTTETLMLRSPAELSELFTKAGVKPGDTIVGYCHIGQQATAMLFAARSLGYNIQLYDGSFDDWAKRDWPVVMPPGR